MIYWEQLLALVCAVWDPFDLGKGFNFDKITQSRGLATLPDKVLSMFLSQEFKGVVQN